MLNEIMGSMKGTIKDMQNEQFKTALGRVNFVIKRKLTDGTELTASSLNPDLLIKSFAKFYDEMNKTTQKK